MGATDVDPGPGTAGYRYAEIDALKALGILTVVLIHSVSTPWLESQTPGERWVLAVTRFAVPGFLFASGFLYSTRSAVPRATTVGRVRRLLLPYLVASGVAQARRYLMGGQISLATIAYDLVTGSSLNPYYYVFVLFWLILLAPALARLPERRLRLVFTVLLALQVADELGIFHLSTTWAWRNPLRWGAYFVLGWLCRLHYSHWTRWVVASRRWLGTTLASLVAAAWIAMAALDQPLATIAAWLHTYAMICAIVVLAGRPLRHSATLGWLSNATYPIYLYHVYFIWMATGIVSMWVPAAARPGRGGIGALLFSRWAAGMAGSLGMIAVARRCVGSRSRQWLGA